MLFDKQGLVAFLVVMLGDMLLTKPVDAGGHGGGGCWSAHSSDSNVTCTHGEGGEECGGTVCLDDDDVSCTGGKCKCGGDSDKGDGILVCARPEEYVCYMISDPRMKPFSGPGVPVPVSCKFILSSFESVSTVDGETVECIVQVAAWGVKGRGAGRSGKHFTGGMEMTVTVTHESMLYYHSSRISGEARFGMYRFSEQTSTIEGGPYGPGVATSVPGIGDIHTVYDETNNIAEVRADFCGVRAGFRPAEFAAGKDDSHMDPGVYIKVNSFYNPNFLGGLCLEPETTIEDVRESLEDVTNKTVDLETAMMALVLKNPISQAFPDAAPVLQTMMDTAQECDLKSLVCAIQQCMFVTKYPKFLRCYGRVSDEDEEESEDGESDDSLDSQEDSKKIENRRMNLSLLLMERCFQAFCAHSSTVCEIVQENVNSTKCERHILEVQKSIMGFDCPSLDMHSIG